MGGRDDDGEVAADILKGARVTRNGGEGKGGDVGGGERGFNKEDKAQHNSRRGMEEK